jgi:hypothetical protein
VLPEAVRDALGQIIANERKEWRRERELIEAQAAATVAELRATITELREEMRASIAERLAALKDGEPGASVTAADVEPIIAAEIARQVAAIPAPRDGRDVDPQAVLQMVADAVAALPPPRAGRDADPEDTRRMVVEQVAAVVAEIPQPAPIAPDPAEIEAAAEAAVERRFATIRIPEDGRDADPADIERAVQAEVERRLPEIAERAAAGVTIPDPIPGADADMDELRAEVRRAVDEVAATIRIPEDGRSVEPEVVERMVAEHVERAVAALPPAEKGNPGDPGADGASVTVEDVAPLIAAEVSRAVAALPPAQKGDDADPAVIADMVERAVAALPAPKDGTGIAGAELDADGHLIVRLTDGAEIDAGRARGEDGAPGLLPLVREWSDAVHYAGDVVTFDGATWQATRDTGRAPPHADWRCIARAGEDGEPGRSFTIRGTWAADTDYAALDVVVLGGSAFVARSDHPGACPGDDWQLIAARGKAGKPGETGVGKRGDPGPPVVAMAVDGEGLLTLTNADGSTVDCDLYPVLAKIGGAA